MLSRISRVFASNIHACRPVVSTRRVFFDLDVPKSSQIPKSSQARLSTSGVCSDAPSLSTDDVHDLLRRIFDPEMPVLHIEHARELLDFHKAVEFGGEMSPEAESRVREILLNCEMDLVGEHTHATTRVHPHYLAQLDEWIGILDEKYGFKDLEEQSPYRNLAASKYGVGMRLKNRADSLQAFETYMTSFITDKKPNTSKSILARIPLLATLGSSRTGKSRLADECAKFCKCFASFEDAICLSVNFNGATGIHASSQERMSARELNSGASWRMLHGLVRHVDWDSFQGEMSQRPFYHIGLGVAFDLIRRQYGDRPIFVTIDEIVNIGDERLVSGFLTTLMRNVDYHTAIMVTSLFQQPLKNFMSLSKREIHVLPLPPLSPEDMKALFRHHPLRKKLFFDAALFSTGGLPGLLATFHSPLLQTDECKDPVTFSQLVDELFKFLPLDNPRLFSTSVVSKLLMLRIDPDAASLEDIPIAEVDNECVSLGRLMKEGYLSLNAPDQIVVPLLFLRRLAKSNLSGLDVAMPVSKFDMSFWSVLLALTDMNLDYSRIAKGIEYEEFLIRYLRLRSLLFSRSRPKFECSWLEFFELEENETKLISPDFVNRMSDVVTMYPLTEITKVERYPNAAAALPGHMYLSTAQNQEGVDLMFVVKDSSGISRRVFVQVKTGKDSLAEKFLQDQIKKVNRVTEPHDIKVWLLGAQELKYGATGYGADFDSKWPRESEHLRNGFFLEKKCVATWIQRSFRAKMEVLACGVQEMLLLK